MSNPRVANALSLIAVFIALGGVSWAAIKLPRNSVGTAQLKKNAVTTKKVKNGTLLRSDFKKGQLPAAGAAGAAGPAGAKGETGPAGPAGPAGSDGTDFAYARTRVVSPGGTDAEAGVRLRDAIAAITDASASKRYLVALEPGVYALPAPLTLPDHIDLRGAGAGATVIRHDVLNTTNAFALSVGTSRVSELAVNRTMPSTNSATFFAGIATRAGRAELDDVAVTVDSPADANVLGVLIAAGSTTRITDSEIEGSSLQGDAYGISSNGTTRISGGSATAAGFSGAVQTIRGIIVFGGKTDVRGMELILASGLDVDDLVLGAGAAGATAELRVHASRIWGSGGLALAVGENGTATVVVGASALTGGASNAPVCTQSYVYETGAAVPSDCSV